MAGPGGRRALFDLQRLRAAPVCGARSTWQALGVVFRLLGEATVKRTRKPRQRATKASERTRQASPADSPTAVYSDKLLKRLVVVERGGQLWLCPRRPGGWSSRQRLQMTPEARQQRLTPARDIDAGTFGIE